MTTITTVEESEQLLAEIKERIKKDSLLFANYRTKNAQALADLGITTVQQREVIESLEAIDYCGGPEPDEKYTWKYVAVFGKSYRGIELYIKFSVGLEGTPVVLISFHGAGKPMEYQFK